MRSILAGLRTLVLPWGGSASQPRIVLGPDVPATLTYTNFSFTGAALWYFDASSYYFEASGVYHQPVPALDIPVMVKGTYDTIQGVLIEEVIEDPSFMVGEKLIYLGWSGNGEHTTFTYRNAAVEIGDGTSQVDQLRVNNVTLYPGTPANVNMDPLSAGTNATGVYANVPGAATLNYTKRYDASQARAEVHISSRITVNASTGIQIGVHVNGTDYDVGRKFFNGIDDHQMISGVAYFGGAGVLPAGTYTATLRYKVWTGTGTATFDGNDAASWDMQETA